MQFDLCMSALPCPALPCPALPSDALALPWPCLVVFALRNVYIALLQSFALLIWS